MKPLYNKPESERAATRAALARALDMVWQMYPTETDIDAVMLEAGVVITAHTFAIQKRRLALAIVNIRNAERKQLMKGEPNEHYTPVKKAATLLQASGYFPRS